MAAEKLKGFEEEFPDIRLGYRAKFPEVQIKFYLQGKDLEALERRSRQAAAWVRQRLGNRIFSENGESMAQVIGRLLVEKGATLAIAESCTGGLLANWITDVAGSSRYFLSAAVVYANEEKTRLLGVKPETLAQHGAVSEAVVTEMAEGVRMRSGATCGLATSGIAGPDGGTPEKPVGLVWIGVSTPEGTRARSFQFRYGNRGANKQMFAMSALEMLRRSLP
jgi:nicotinamide-nucleotide amidase